MGSPLSPIIANIYMEHFEEKTLSSAPMKPKVWRRYVDDTFVLWSHGRETLESFLNHLNSHHNAIQFTMEEEVDRQIAFLDVLVRREGNKLTTSVYRKKTHTDRYLDYNSHHHPRVLAGVVKCLKNRAVSICDTEYLQEEIRHLDDAFRSNNFPQKVLDPILNKVDTAKQTRPSTNENTEDNRENRTLCVPYVRGLSEKIANVCRSIKGVNMRAVFKPCRTIRQMLVRVKNRIPEDRRKGVIYEIPCQDCEKVYIGETGRTLKKRVSEHKEAVRKFNMNNGVGTHVHNEDHRIDWEGAKVIGQQEFYWKRRVTEAIMIYQHNQQTMNLDCGLNLSKLWHASLDKPS